MLKRLLLVLLFAASGFTSFAADYTRYVSVNSLALKEKASSMSKTVASVSYGDQVTISKVSGKWSLIAPVSSPSVKGWVNTSALSKRKIVVGKKVSTDADEISLAGKGFSEGLEGEYSKKGEADYASVDLIEENFVSDNERAAFIKAGQLKGGEE